LVGVADVGRLEFHLLLDAVDEYGQRVMNLRAGWTWVGRRGNEPARPFPLDKPPGEPMGNLPIFSGQIITVWIVDDIPSERVSGLHTLHPDEPGPGNELWNTRGHHSFHVVFKRVLFDGSGGGGGGDEFLRALDLMQAHIEQLRKSHGVLSINKSSAHVLGEPPEAPPGLPGQSERSR